MDNQLNARQQTLEAIRVNHLKMSQRELAKNLGYSRSFIAMVETGKKPCSDALWDSLKEFAVNNLKGDTMALFRGVEGAK